MNKILFLDIDRTLFDSDLFLDTFYTELRGSFGLPENTDLNSFYQNAKNEKGYFDPEIFVKNISNSIQVDENKINEVFWDDKLIDDCLYPDALSIKNLLNKTTLGIFSKGDEKFQMKKIVFLNDLLEEKNIFITSNKFESMATLLNNYSDFEISFVDDELDVLISEKKLKPDVNVFLIDRKGNLEDNVEVRKIKSLEELENLV